MANGDEFFFLERKKSREIKNNTKMEGGGAVKYVFFGINKMGFMWYVSGDMIFFYVLIT